MLTGDKLGTAENIAKSCRLLTQYMYKTQLRTNDKDSINNFFTETMKTLKKCKKENLKQAILVEGDALKTILDRSEGYDMQFLKIAMQCHAVVICRCSPK